MVRRLLGRRAVRTLLLAAAAFFAAPTASALAGNLAATGHDIDFHCSGNAQCGYVRALTDFVRSGAPDPTKPVLVLDRDDVDFVEALDNAYGPGVVPRVVMDPRSAEFASAPLTTNLYSAILIASDITCGGCDLNEFDSTPDSDAINARATDLANFFNAGGGLLYASGAAHGDGSGPDDVYYASAPLPVGGLPVAPPFTVTPAGEAIGLTNEDANCCATHNSFVEPPAGSAIVVAERDSAGSAETLIARGTIVGGRIFTLTLTPESATNATGTPHTVTATLVDEEGPVANATIRFTVTGPNATSGTGTTNASGVATFQYTGTTAGTDTITACYDANNNGTCGETGDVIETATKTWTGGPPPETGTIVIVKRTEPGGAGKNFRFFPHGPDFDELVRPVFVLDDDPGSATPATQTYTGLTPGEYVIREDERRGWEVSNVTCDDPSSTGDSALGRAVIDLDAGETVTCTFTNARNGDSEEGG